MNRRALHNASLFRSTTDEWATPEALFDELDKEFAFDLDPCSSRDNHKCAVYFTRRENGLAQPWLHPGAHRRRGRVFMNPPYGRTIGRWVKKAYDEVICGNAELVVCLLPARTDTKWFHDYCLKAGPDNIRFIRGRLKFGDAKNAAPFPSAIVIFRRGYLRDAAAA